MLFFIIFISFAFFFAYIFLLYPIFLFFILFIFLFFFELSFRGELFTILPWLFLVFCICSNNFIDITFISFSLLLLDLAVSFSLLIVLLFEGLYSLLSSIIAFWFKLFLSSFFLFLISSSSSVTFSFPSSSSFLFIVLFSISFILSFNFNSSLFKNSSSALSSFSIFLSWLSTILLLFLLLFLLQVSILLLLCKFSDGILPKLIKLLLWVYIRFNLLFWLFGVISLFCTLSPSIVVSIVSVKLTKLLFVFFSLLSAIISLFWEEFLENFGEPGIGLGLNDPLLNNSISGWSLFSVFLLLYISLIISFSSSFCSCLSSYKFSSSFCLSLFSIFSPLSLIFSLLTSLLLLCSSSFSLFSSSLLLFSLFSSSLSLLLFSLFSSSILSLLSFSSISSSAFSFLTDDSSLFSFESDFSSFSLSSLLSSPFSSSFTK